MEPQHPPTLPLVMNAQEFGLPLDKLRDFMLRDPPRGHEPIHSTCNPGMTGFFDPLLGVAYGERLAARIGSLLSRPACRFSHAFTWRAVRGASMGGHRDRPEYDVTMSIPLVLDGVDRWPLWWKQPNGERCEWAGTPGTVLIVDGQQRRHGRGEFQGTRSVVLLLHWTAPAVLWPGFLDEGARRGLAAAGPRLDAGPGAGRALLDRCLGLAQSAVPHSVEPEAVVCGDPAQASAAVEASGGRGAAFVALLDGRAVLTLGAPDGTLDDAPDAAPDTVELQPGDGVAFSAETRECRLRWLEGGRGKALVGRTRWARAGVHRCADRRAGQPLSVAVRDLGG